MPTAPAILQQDDAPRLSSVTGAPAAPASNQPAAPQAPFEVGRSVKNDVSVPVSNFEPMSICVSMRASYFPLPATASPSRVR